jgi:hypothetical protein
MTKQRLTSIIAVTLICAMTGIVWWRAIRPMSTTQFLSNQEMAEAGVRLYARLDMAPLESLGSIRDVVERAHVVDGDLVAREYRRSVLDSAAEFLWYYYGSRSADEYIDWRRRDGYTLLGINDAPNGIYAWNFLFDGPTPDDDAEVFRRVWTAVHEYGDGANQAVAISNNDDGLVLLFKVVNELDDGLPFPSDAPKRGKQSITGAEQWVGGIAGGANNWWRAPVPFDQVMEQDGQVTVATLGAILEFKNGRRRPISITWFFDPRSGSWRLHAISESNANFKHDKVIGINY